MTTSDVLWPATNRANLTGPLAAYLDFLTSTGRDFTSFRDLWEWSVEDLDAFWVSISEFFNLGIASDCPLEGNMPNPKWFPGATLNYAELCLRGADEDLAIVGYSQTRPTLQLTKGELRKEVAQVRAGLLALGVGEGDRVGAILPNIPEAIVTMLATVSIGAVFSSCAPEFGASAILDRFRQIEPKVLVCVDGYRYGDRDLDRRSVLDEVVAGLPSLTAVVRVPYLFEPAAGQLTWAQLHGRGESHDVTRVPFDHPLFILYSSGTTGPPKSIVHCHGGIVLEHAKALGLHLNLGAGDRFCWFSTTGWMMWNFLVSGLLVGSSVVTFDGNPGAPDLGELWRIAVDSETSFLGLGAPLITAFANANLDPHAYGNLDALRGLGSTGSPLDAAGFRWVRSQLGEQVRLHSISGGSDVCTAFVGMSPLLAVRAGEISGPYLGVNVESYDHSGRPVRGEDGELVVETPMPSMPIGFFGDPDGIRYRDAYFSAFPGVWAHGDWIRIENDRSCVISGRSDSTLNRGGVRMGTAELYSIVENDDRVVDSLVVHLDGADDELLLFLHVSDADVSFQELSDDLRYRLRTQLSPRHAPDLVIAVSAIPRTSSGKKLEIPIKRLLVGHDGAEELLLKSVADPQSIEDFVHYAATRHPNEEH